MPHKKIPRKVTRQLVAEQRKLNELRSQYPEIFRKCGDKPCCQAVTKNGKLCSRPAFTDKLYLVKLRCCYLCWQHATSFGVYFAAKLAKSLATAHMDMDEYCYYFPDECEEMLNDINK